MPLLLLKGEQILLLLNRCIHAQMGYRSNVCFPTIPFKFEGCEDDQTGLSKDYIYHLCIAETTVVHGLAPSFQRELQMLTCVSGPSVIAAWESVPL